MIRTRKTSSRTFGDPPSGGKSPWSNTVFVSSGLTTPSPEEIRIAPNSSATRPRYLWKRPATRRSWPRGGVLLSFSGAMRQVLLRGVRSPLAAAERVVDRAEGVLVELDARGGRVLRHLLGPARADDRGGDFRPPQHPCERELPHRQAEPVRDRPQPLDPLEHVVAEEAVHEPAHRLGGRSASLRRRLARLVLAREDALRERRPDDLRDPVLRAEREDLALGLPPEHRVLRLARDELLRRRREVERRPDLLRLPFGEAEVARLALPHHLGEGVHRLLERRLLVVAVALVEVDVVGAQPCERRVDLLEDLLAREAAVARRHGEVELRREHVRVARAAREHLAEELLRLAAAVDVRRVDEVDALVEGPG